MLPGDLQEQFRSQLVEAYCPYVGRRILGYVTHRLVREADGEGQVHLRQEVVRADCLLRETCEDLGCHRGVHPLAAG